MLSYSERKTFARNGAANIDGTVARAVAEVKATRDAEIEANKAAWELRHKPVPFTEEQWKAAVVVRTLTGWRKVVRVNAKTVTVSTPYSWTDRIARDKVLEVRS